MNAFRLVSIGGAVVAFALLAYGLYRLTIAIGRKDATVQVHFIIPDGYRGLFKLAPGGTEAPLLKEGVYIYQIPETGILKVKSPEPLRQWHTTTASYQSGAALEFQGGAPVKPESAEIKLRSVISDSEGNVYYLVGSEEKLAEILKSNDRSLGGIAK